MFLFTYACTFSFGHDIRLLDSTTDLLCGDQNSVKWIDMSGRLPEDISSLNLVEGGQDGDGNPLYVAQVEIKGAVVPGK